MLSANDERRLHLTHRPSAMSFLDTAMVSRNDNTTLLPNTGILDSLHDKKAVVIGSYLALIARAYLKDSNMAVISSNETSHILPESVHVIRNDYSKKANLVISIMMNALDKKFDVTHDHKV